MQPSTVSVPADQENPRRLKRWHTVFGIIVAVALLALYLSCAKKLWPYNPLFFDDLAKSYDQTFYIQMAEDMANHSPAILPRSRMPFYPWVMHFFCETGKDSKELLPTYIRLNIAISVLSLGGIFFLSRRWLGTWLAALTTVVVAFRVYIFKAVLVQPELLFYTLYFALFLLLGRLLQRPSWRVALVAGLVGGIAHLTKGSGLPMIAIFLGLATCQSLWLFWKSRRAEAHLSGWDLFQPAFFLAAFLSVTGTYLYHSYQVYGSPFYDPNTRYYFWAESPDEMVAMQRLGLPSGKPHLNAALLDNELIAGFMPKWVPDQSLRDKIAAAVHGGADLILEGPYDILPSFQHWRASHTLADARDRIWFGLIGDFHDPEQAKTISDPADASKHVLQHFPLIHLPATANSLVGHNREHSNGYWPYLSFLYFSSWIALILACIFDWRRMVALARSHWLAILFAAATLGLTTLSYAWWGEISFRNRYFLSLYLPLLFCLSLVCRAALTQLPLRLEATREQKVYAWSAYTLFLVIYTVLLATDIDDPLNHGVLRDPGDYMKLLVQ